MTPNPLPAGEPKTAAAGARSLNADELRLIDA